MRLLVSIYFLRKWAYVEAEMAQDKTKAPVKKTRVATTADDNTAQPATARLRRGIATIPYAERTTGVVNKQLTGFVDFIREQSVVGLAIGLVMGTQIKQVVDALIASFINPLVGLLLPGKGGLDQKKIIVQWHDKTADFTWGSFVLTMISFTIVAAVIYFTFKALKLDKLTKKKETT